MTEHDYTLDPKRVDEDEFEDRLTTNARDALIPSRYAIKDTNGNPVEEPREVFVRVAKNVAVAEAAHHDQTVLIEPRHIKPDHPSREEKIEAVFGDEESDQIPLDEHNAKWVAYDPLLEDLDDDSDVALDLELWKEEFENAMTNLQFIPNSPTLMNAGDDLQQLSACFVDSPEDDLSKIYETINEAAEVFQSGGGMGYAWQYLRPKGDRVGSTGGIASGPITFMRSADQMCETIAQGGSRRGAQMGNMRITHPDVLFFIHAKNKDVSLARALNLDDPDDPTHRTFGGALEEAREIIERESDEDGRLPPRYRNAIESHLSNFNISVEITDDFMQAVKSGDDFQMVNPRTGEPFEATPETKEMYSWWGLGDHVEVGEPLSVPARELWEDIVEGAHENGEPGVIFIDRVNDDHSFDVESTSTYDPEDSPHEIHATNPCGEQPLQEYEACNLGHINLSTLVADNAPKWADIDAVDLPDDESTQLEAQVEHFLNKAIDWDKLNHRIETGTRFLDNVVTMSAFPIEEISETVRKNRKIGLGIMGLAELFVQLGVKYGSEVGNEVARQVMVHINQRSKTVSRNLAAERGRFEHWEDSKYADPTEYREWFERQTGESADDWEDGYPIRNHNTTTIAPTGSTSMVGNTTGGCEPIYQVAFYKNVTDDVQGDEMLVEFNDYFLRVLEDNDIDVDAAKQEAQDQMANNEFDGVDSLETVPDEIGELFVTTQDLSGIEHAGVQCALQEGVDSAISKTCNFPNSATAEDMDKVYRYIYEHDGKGVTVYRDGTRTKQVKTTRQDNQETDEDDADTDDDTTTEEDTDATSNGDETPTSDAENDGKFVEVRDRGKVLFGTTERISTGYGALYLTVNFDEDNDPFEVIGEIDKGGTSSQADVEGICRSISQSLRAGVPAEQVVEQQSNIRAPDLGFDGGEKIYSIPHAIAVGLARAIENYPPEHLQTADTQTPNVDAEAVQQSLATTDGGMDGECEWCGGPTIYQEGCEKCKDQSGCGWSKC